MDSQPDFDFDTHVSPEDMAASFVPASFDHYLVQAKMRHTGSRPDTKSKAHSDYDLSPPDVIYYFRNVHIKHLCASLHTY
jgi:hypothetical protein